MVQTYYAYVSDNITELQTEVKSSNRTRIDIRVRLEGPGTDYIVQLTDKFNNKSDFGWDKNTLGVRRSK